MKDFREAVLKLEAADKLRSQGFLRSEQNLPKTNKRGEWLFCVCVYNLKTNIRERRYLDSNESN